MGWHLAETVIGTTSVTLSEELLSIYDQVEILVEIKLTQNNVDISLFGSLLIPNNNNLWVMNGYVTSSTDWGLVDFNLSDHGRTIELNNCYYAATQHNTDAVVNVYYRAEESLLSDDTIAIWTEILGGDPSLIPSANNISTSGSTWTKVANPTVPSGFTLIENNLYYKISNDRNTIILTGRITINVEASVSSGVEIQIPLGFQTSTRPSSLLKIPVGSVISFTWNAATGQVNQNYVKYVCVDTSGNVYISFMMNNNSGVICKCFADFEGAFVPLTE